ncbi:hypothetical protein DRO26_03140 [Candidatus Bathyarchaeota archaeon]|nr:MAG: hypothetical protein DRO26_03140 [Candidatus Bathyarchaeota archaeon]
MTTEERALMTRKFELHPEKCSGCLQCLMACSLKYEGVVNPLKARSKIVREGGITKRIVMSENCTFCGFCVSVCYYGARKLKGGGS